MSGSTAASTACAAGAARGSAALELSDVVPILEHMGVRVADERPYEIAPVEAPVSHISDFGLHPVVDVEIVDDVREAFEDGLWRAL